MAVFHGYKLTATANTPVALATSNTPAKWILFQPKTDNAGVPTNVGTVWLGGPGVTPTTGGVFLNPGDSIVAWPGGGEYLHDLQQIFIVAPTGGDGVQFIYGG